MGLATESGELVFEDRIRTPRATDPEALFRVLGDLLEIGIKAAAGRGQLIVCGVGSGGPMTLGGETISPLNIPAWRAFPLRRRLADLLSGFEATKEAPVFVDNDAKALALAEGWQGAARGERNFIAMVVSTGVGGGIVLDGRLLDGAGGNAGHIGHLIVEPGGALCGCGARGCLEAEVSGTGIQNLTGAPAEQAAVEIVERTGRLVGRAVASVANLLDLRLALIGGGVALGFGLRFFIAAQRELDACARIEHARGCRIEPVGLGPVAPLVGAAAVGWRGLAAPSWAGLAGAERPTGLPS